MKKEEWDAEKKENRGHRRGRNRQPGASALWARAKSEITPEQYEEFYKHVGARFRGAAGLRPQPRSKASRNTPSCCTCRRTRPFDLWDREQRHGIKLYVRRVFIMDDAEQLMPPYLRFVRGVIDSNDLPLNVSREILQQSKDIEAIRAGSVKKVLGLLEDLAENQQGEIRQVLEANSAGC